MRYLVAIIALAIIAALVWFYVSPSQTFTAAPNATSSTPTVQVSTATVEATTSTYVIDAQYPQFGIASIDAQIKKMVDDSITEIKGYPANPPDMATPQNQLWIRYEQPYIGSDIISVRLITSEYTGGAHPNTIVSGINFERASGRQLLQNDAFTMLGMSVNQVSMGATAQLKEKLGEQFMFEEGANSNPENFSSFQIGTSSITFIFQPYQVAAYAAGPQEVVFPRAH